MRRAPIVAVGVAVAALGCVWAGSVAAPCAMPPVLMAKIAPGKVASCPAPATVAADQPRAVEPPAVTVVPAAKREFVDRLFVSGTLVAREEAQVAARIDGLTVVEVDAEDGDRVKQGQVLARLDRTQLDALVAENDAATRRADAAIDQAQSMIAQSQAQLQFASDDFDRARKLAGGVMAVSTIEQRETAMKTAQAQLAAAQNALSVAEADRKSRDAERQELLVRIDRTEVKAPVAGIVSRRSAKLGADASSAGEPLFRIIEDGAVDLEADVPEQSLARLAVGMPAELKLPGVEGAVAGRVRLVNQEVDKASRTGKVRIALEDVSRAHIGAFASGRVELIRRDGVGAPATAFEREGDSARLYVVRDGKVEERQVRPGIVDGDSVEIESGVAAGESVVARAASFLRPGDRVRPVPEAAASAGG
jgi:HlyD family secretion protein